MSWVSLSADNNSGKDNYKDVANDAFVSPTNLTSRLGNRAPKESSSSGGSSSSRREPSQIHSSEDAEAFHEMFKSTTVQVSKKKGMSVNKPTDLGTGLKALGARANRYIYDSTTSMGAEVPGMDNGSTVTDNSFSIGSVERRTKDLDLSNNDNSFHVIGGLIVEFFQSKKNASPDGKVKLSAQDLAQLDRLAPRRVRASFVEAARHRFTNAPSDAKSSVHVLARQCHELGLDALYPHNPLLVANEMEMEAALSTSSNNNNRATSYSFNAPDSDALDNSKRNLSSSSPAYKEKPEVETITDENELSSYNYESAPTAPKHEDQNRCNDYHQLPPTGRLPRSSDPPGEGERNNIERSSVANSGGSVGTRLTKMGVEVPLREDGYPSSGSNPQQHKYEMSLRAGAGYSNNSEELYTKFGHGSEETQQPPLRDAMNRAPNLSMAKTEESSVISPGDYGNPENLAKQQLLAELCEAENLMAESKTQEAAKFWRDHVQELQARLETLDGSESVVSDHKEKLLEQFSTEQTEQKTGSMFMNRDNYMPPNLNVFQGTAANGTSNDGPGSVPETACQQASLRIDPSLEGVPMVDVVAPADLPGGYNFEAEIGGRRFLATVPAGGVQKGETFSCYMRDLDQVGSDVPVGRWRDGLFDCFSFGLCHPVICNAFFCPLVLLGQIMTRVGFDFLGRPSLDNSINGPSTLWTILSFWVFVNVALFCAYNVKWSRGLELSGADLGALAFVNITYNLFVVYLTSATRGSLREKYYIRESRFHDLEDCCCATFCLPLSLAQMARHSVDYSSYEAVCCNDTGLREDYDFGGSKEKDVTSSAKNIKQYIV